MRHKIPTIQEFYYFGIGTKIVSFYCNIMVYEGYLPWSCSVRQKPCFTAKRKQTWFLIMRIFLYSFHLKFLDDLTICIWRNWWFLHTFFFRVNNLFKPLNVQVFEHSLNKILILKTYAVSVLIYLFCFLFFRRLLGIITKKDVLRHIAQLGNQDPESILFN